MENAQKKSTRHTWVMILELICGAVIMELLIVFLGNTLPFRYIDVRLWYVVAAASVYGLKGGLPAAALACVSIIYAYYSQQTDMSVFFADPDNYLLFALLFVGALICGTTRDHHDEKEAGNAETIADLQEENHHLRQLYQETDTKEQAYKKDLILSHDGYAQMYEAARTLSSLEPAAVCRSAVHVLEKVFETKSVAIYEITRKEAEEAVLVCASAGNDVRPQRLPSECFHEITAHVSDGNVWVNKDLKKGFPLYAAGINEQEQLRILILLYDVPFAQMNAYYLELFRILSGLAGVFLKEAWADEEKRSAVFSPLMPEAKEAKTI